MKIPSGWKIVINTFYECYTFQPPDKKINTDNYFWDRDVMVLCFDNWLYLELQDYICNDDTSLLHIEVYDDKNDNFSKLEQIFCYSVKEA